MEAELDVHVQTTSYYFKQVYKQFFRHFMNRAELNQQLLFLGHWLRPHQQLFKMLQIPALENARNPQLPTPAESVKFVGKVKMRSITDPNTWVQ
jgi:hypothetical protein